MSNFEEDEILVRCVREAYGEDADRNAPRNGIQLERGEYQGYNTYCLREVWEPERNEWRWSQMRRSQSGKVWSRMGIKRRELREIGEALIRAADEADQMDGGPRRSRRSAGTHSERNGDARLSGQVELPTNAATVDDSDDIPF